MAKKKKVKSSRKTATIIDGNFATATDGQNGNRVFVSVGKTINIGNYESMKVEYGTGRTVNDGQKFSEVADLCKADAANSLKEMIRMVEDALNG